MCSYQPWWLFCTRNCSSLNLLLRLEARSWCWRQRGQQCEFRKKNPAKVNWMTFQTNANRVTFIVEGQLCGSRWERHREGGPTLCLCLSSTCFPPLILLQVQDSHPATGIVRVSSQTSQSQLTPASQLQRSYSSSTTQSTLRPESKAPWRYVTNSNCFILFQMLFYFGKLYST